MQHYVLYILSIAAEDGHRSDRTRREGSPIPHYKRWLYE